MEHICRRCLNLRRGLHVVRKTQISTLVKQTRTGINCCFRIQDIFFLSLCKLN